jgi:hypothetical protein
MKPSPVPDHASSVWTVRYQSPCCKELQGPRAGSSRDGLPSDVIDSVQNTGPTCGVNDGTRRAQESHFLRTPLDDQTGTGRGQIPRFKCDERKEGGRRRESGRVAQDSFGGPPRALRDGTRGEDALIEEREAGGSLATGRHQPQGPSLACLRMTPVLEHHGFRVHNGWLELVPILECGEVVPALVPGSLRHSPVRSCLQRVLACNNDVDEVMGRVGSPVKVPTRPGSAEKRPWSLGRVRTVVDETGQDDAIDDTTTTQRPGLPNMPAKLPRERKEAWAARRGI